MQVIKHQAPTQLEAKPFKKKLIDLSIQSAIMLALAPVAIAQQNAATATEAEQETQVQSLSQVEVRAAAETEAGSSTAVTREDIEKSGATSMGDVIRHLPGVEAPSNIQGATRGASRHDRAGTTGFNIRGMEGNRVGLDIDGIEMPEGVDRAATGGGRANNGTFGMGRDFIDPGIYSGMDVQYGTSNSRRSAGGIGGSVGFRTPQPEDYVNAEKPLHVGANLGYSDSNSAWTKGVTAAATNNNGLSGLFSYIRRDAEQSKNNSSTGLKNYPADWSTDAILLKGALRLSPAQRLELSADIYRKQDDSQFEAWNSTVTAITGMSYQDSKTERNTLSLGHKWTPVQGPIDYLDTRLYYQNTNMEDVTDTTTLSSGATTSELSQNKNYNLGFSTTGDKRIGQHNLKFGVNASRNINTHPLQSSTGSSLSQPYPDTKTVRLGAFVEDRIDFSVADKRLSVTPALRVDKVDSQVRPGTYNHTRITPEEIATMYGNAPGSTILSPSLSVMYELASDFNAYAQWRRSGRAPSVSEYYGYWNGGGGNYAVVGNRDLKEERSDAFELGVKGRLAEGVQLSSSAYYSRIKNEISYTRFTRPNNPEMFVNMQDRLTFIYQAENRDKAKIYGFDLSTRLDWGTWAPSVNGLYSTLGMNLTKGKSKSHYAGDKWVDKDSVQPARAVASLGYNAPSKRWGAELFGNFVKGKQAEATNRLSYSNDPGTELADSATELVRVGGYAVFDLAGYWQINKNMRLNAGIYNLTDKEYRRYSGTRNLQTTNAQDQRQFQLSTEPGRTYRVNLAVEF